MGDFFSNVRYLAVYFFYVANETVEVYGLDLGSKISIYAITGAKASSYTYNGQSLNLSHLNTGVYFLETPGYSVKKF